ncbi:50S ribosomal protein L6 [Candidatus Uhrbacteria bacterium]|nr:50S ribosomal protein L6 [Candidatus Uhrbacteria bacterium]
MSRIGKQPITLPAGVTATIASGLVTVRGPKGEVAVPLHPRVRVELEGTTLRVSVTDPTAKNDRALWGLGQRLVQNAVIGVTKGFSTALEVHGVGFRAEVKGGTIELHLGFSHPIRFPLPTGITASVEKNTVTLSGIDTQLVGETAARIRALRKPDAYHGKGVRYVGEVLKLKPGKAVKGTASQ